MLLPQTDDFYAARKHTENELIDRLPHNHNLRPPRPNRFLGQTKTEGQVHTRSAKVTTCSKGLGGLAPRPPETAVMRQPDSPPLPSHIGHQNSRAWPTET